MIGLWHYPIPGFFLLAQFCLGILVALGNLVNNSVFLWLSNEGTRVSTVNENEEGKHAYATILYLTLILSAIQRVGYSFAFFYALTHYS